MPPEEVKSNRAWNGRAAVESRHIHRAKRSASEVLLHSVKAVLIYLTDPTTWKSQVTSGCHFNLLLGILFPCSFKEKALSGRMSAFAGEHQLRIAPQLAKAIVCCSWCGGNTARSSVPSWPQHCTRRLQGQAQKSHPSASSLWLTASRRSASRSPSSPMARLLVQ